MTLRQIATYLLIFLLALLVFRWGLSPLRTRLPENTTDLSTIESELDRLTAEEQKLVRDYTARSEGEYIPAGSSGPEAPPLDARTVGDAIELQRRFLATLDEHRYEACARAAQRDAALGPMRAVLQLEQVSREMASVDAVYAPRSDAPYGATPAAPKGELQAITRWRVRNVSGRVITSFEGQAHAYEADGDILSPVLLNHCHIEQASALPPGASIDVGCGDRLRRPDWDRAYVASPAGAISTDWMPRRIAFSDGTELRYDGH